jgi:type II secretory pathway pseudopilin PulG
MSHSTGGSLRVRARSARGLSLVEVSIILMVLSILTAVIAPSAAAYLETSKHTRAKEDVEAIASAVDQLLRDTGMLCLSLNGTSCANSATGRVELLVSGTVDADANGTFVDDNEPAVATTSFGATASTASSTNLNWAGGANEVANARRDLMDRQFVTNLAGYAAPGFTSGGGPKAGIGWRGAYLSGPIDLDPWGYVYQANTVFLAVASDAVDGTGAGEKRGGWTTDVVVISPGSNGVIQTAFGSSAVAAVGDDVLAVIQGGTR